MGLSARAGEAQLNKNEELKADDEKDTKLTKSPRKVYKVKLAEGKTYQIDLKSKDFDAFLRVEDATGMEVAFNDDARGGGTYDSRVIYKPAKSGEYSIIATSLDSKPGKFQLTLAETDASSINSAFVGKAIPLVLKDGKARHEGELTADDPTVANKFYKVFTIQLDTGKTYRIDHRGGSPGFDAYLFLEDTDGNSLASDDDSGGKLDSQIKHKVSKAGTYRIITTTLPTRQAGKFTLDIVAIDGKEQKESRAPRPGQILTPVGVKDISRWLSAAIPPDDETQETAPWKGASLRRLSGTPLGSMIHGCHYSGGIAPLNRRLIAGTPSGVSSGCNGPGMHCVA